MLYIESFVLLHLSKTMNSFWNTENACQVIVFDLLLQKLRAKGHCIQRIINSVTVHHKTSNGRISGTNCMNTGNVIPGVNF